MSTDPSASNFDQFLQFVGFDVLEIADGKECISLEQFVRLVLLVFFARFLGAWKFLDFVGIFWEPLSFFGRFQRPVDRHDPFSQEDPMEHLDGSQFLCAHHHVTRSWNFSLKIQLCLPGLHHVVVLEARNFLQFLLVILQFVEFGVVASGDRDSRHRIFVGFLLLGRLGRLENFRIQDEFQDVVPTWASWEISTIFRSLFASWKAISCRRRPSHRPEISTTFPSSFSSLGIPSSPRRPEEFSAFNLNFNPHLIVVLFLLSVLLLFLLVLDFSILFLRTFLFLFLLLLFLGIFL